MENSPEDMSVLLQFAKFSRGFQINDFYEFIEKTVGLDQLDFFGRLAYPNQWQMRLTDRNTREILIQAGRKRINNRSCWIYPLNKQEIRGFVHWLPNSVTNDQLKEQLQKYGDVLFVQSQEQDIKGRRIENDPRYYGLILPNTSIKEDLPHFFKINGYMCLVVVRGREPACYHCKEVGHRKAECQKYKTKLISYCNREPNTAPPRLRPRGRRHEKAQIGVRAETGRSQVSSSDDVVCSERIPFAESITEPRLSALEDRQHAIETYGEATGSTENDFEVSDVPAQKKAASWIESSIASFSETQTSDILERIQNFKQTAEKKFQQDLKNFEEEISLIFTRELHSIDTRDQKQSTTATEDTYKNSELETENIGHEMEAKELYAPEECTTSVEMTESDSYASMDILYMGTKSIEIGSDLPAMLQVKVDSAESYEKMSKKSEEIPQDIQSTEWAAKDSASSSDTISPELLMLKEIKQAASEIFERTRKKLGEFSLSIKASEEPSKDSATDTVPKLTEKDGQDLLNMLKNLKTITTEHSSFKKVEANLFSELSGESEAKLTEEDKYFAKQLLEKTKENTSGILQNTLQKLEERVMDVMKQSQTVTETESGAASKIASIITQPDETLEPPKQDIGTVVDICQKNLDATMENASEILQKTLKNLEEKVVEMAKQSKTTKQSANASGATPKTASTATKPDSTSKQRKQKIFEAMHREKKFRAAKEKLTVQSDQEEKVVKVAKQPETSTEIATESEATVTIANIEVQPGAALEQPEQDIDLAQPICKSDIEVSETETSEMASKHGKSPEETFQAESDPVQEYLKPTEICEPSEGDEATTEEACAGRKESETNISKAVQEDLDQLQAKLKKILASLQDKAISSETITILQKAESKVVEVVEETKNKWKKED